MVVATAKLTLYAEWCASLKEKRMIVKSLIAKLQNKFNVSAAEVEEMDNHKVIVIGVACVSNDNRHADSMLTHVVNFAEGATEALVTDIVTEISRFS